MADPLVRRALISKSAIWIARLALPRALGKLADPNSGYFLLRRSVIERVELRPIGFKILIEVLARGRPARVVERPYPYEGRTVGASKLGWRQSLQFISHLVRLAWETGSLTRRARSLRVPITGSSSEAK